MVLLATGLLSRCRVKVVLASHLVDVVKMVMPCSFFDLSGTGLSTSTTLLTSCLVFSGRYQGDDTCRLVVGTVLLRHHHQLWCVVVTGRTRTCL